MKTRSIVRWILVTAAVVASSATTRAAELRRDVEYGVAGGERLLLDASIPDGAGPFPIAILVHGGGWAHGDKSGSDKPGDGADISPWFAQLTAANFAWVSINYRLAPAHRWPACLEDVETAIRWVKTHAAELKADPRRVVVFGHSAGAQLVCLAGLRATDAATRVQAVVAFAAVTDVEQDLPRRGGLVSPGLQDLLGVSKEVTPATLALLRDFSPINAVRDKPAPPPFLLVHGDADRPRFQQSLNFQSRLRAAGGVCDLISIPGGPHGFLTWSKIDPTYPDRMIAWLRAKLGGTARRDRAATEVVASELAPAAGTAPRRDPLRLWYRRPAAAWTEALPVGNGRLGAMVFGGLAEERLQLNDDTLWDGAPHAYHHEGAAKVLPELRALLFAGKQKEAEELATREFMSVPLRQKMYQPLGDVLLQFRGHDSATDYRRELDLDAAVATVRYRAGDTGYTREIFASHPDQVIVQRITAERRGSLNFAVRMGAPHPATRARALDANALLITGRVQDDGLRFAAQVHVTATGGKVSATESGIVVENADEAIVRVTAATSFRNFRDISADPEAAAAGAMKAALAVDFARLRERHVADHRGLFRRVTIDLGSSPAAALPTDERLARADKSGDPQLASLMFQYGRYLLIASSRPGDQPANLQGIWNDRTNPPWGSKYTVNINTEMNYWPAEVANLPECAEPLWAMLDDLVVSGRETARAHYGARGWVLHHNTDLWRGTAPINASNHGIWPTGGAWLSQHLWEHYLFTLDRDFLARRAYPIMKGAAEFFVDYLVKDPRTGRLISGPSNSPEQGGLVMGPTMDHQIIRALFASTAAAAGALGVDADFAAQLTRLHAAIAPNQVGRHGQLQEWLEDKDDPDNHHRHTSHLWGVFPGNEISPATPELFRAARQSLLFRGDEGTGWSLGWKICFWARFLEGDHALRMIWQQLRFVQEQGTKTSGGGTYANLFDAHPPFQIDGNFAATAGICEMLLQSQHGEIALLPALPKAWPDGAVKGLRARGGFEVDFAWRGGRLTTATVRSAKGGAATLRAGSATQRVTLRPGEAFGWTPADAR